MKSLKGQLLLASPGLVDPNFVRTVVFIAEHNDEGALGFVLNRPAKTRLAELWSSISAENDEVAVDAIAFVGGPVQGNAVLFLHGCEDLAGDAEPIIPGVYLGSQADLLKEVLQRAGESAVAAASDAIRFRVFCGYSGWGPGQLDGEMKAGGWLTCPASADQVFRDPPETLWNRAIEAKGGVYRFFALMPPKPEHN